MSSVTRFPFWSVQGGIVTSLKAMPGTIPIGLLSAMTACISSLEGAESVMFTGAVF